MQKAIAQLNALSRVSGYTNPDKRSPVMRQDI